MVALLTTIIQFESNFPLADTFSAYAEQKPKYSYLFAAPKEYAPWNG